MFRAAGVVAVLMLSGCTTIPLGETHKAEYYGGVSRDGFLHVMPLPFGRRLILIRDGGVFFCWGTPKKTSCKPTYTGTGLRTRDTSLDP